MTFTPDQELIGRDQVRRRLGDISDRTLDRIIAAGHLPRGVGRPPKWFAADCDCYLWLHGRGALPRPSRPEGKNPKEKPENSG